MKFKISYLPEEEPEATADLAVLLSQHPGAKVHKSEAKTPYKHIYLTTKKPAKPRGPRGQIDSTPPT